MAYYDELDGGAFGYDPNTRLCTIQQSAAGRSVCALGKPGEPGNPACALNYTGRCGMTLKGRRQYSQMKRFQKYRAMGRYNPDYSLRPREPTEGQLLALAAGRAIRKKNLEALRATPGYRPSNMRKNGTIRERKKKEKVKKNWWVKDGANQAVLVDDDVMMNAVAQSGQKRPARANTANPKRQRSGEAAPFTMSAPNGSFFNV